MPNHEQLRLRAASTQCLHGLTWNENVLVQCGALFQSGFMALGRRKKSMIPQMTQVRRQQNICDATLVLAALYVTLAKRRLSRRLYAR